MENYQDRLAALREQMEKKRIDAFIVPSFDPHQSEYVAAHWQARRWLTGFDGSAGVAVVTQKEAHLWTDSRYFIQAEEQLEGSGFELMRLKVPHTPEYIDWLKEQLPEGATVGVDGQLYAVAQLRRLRKQLSQNGLSVRHDEDLIGQIWKSRPSLPKDPVFELELVYAGQSRHDKLMAVRGKMKSDFLLVTALDEIAWLLNIRGNDVPCNPVAISYFLLGRTSAVWFIEGEKVPRTVLENIFRDGVELQPYSQLAAYLEKLPGNEEIAYLSSATSIQLYETLPAGRWLAAENLISPLKAIRNEVEQQQLRVAMRKDGVALLKFYRWLDGALEQGGRLTEYDLGIKLDECRAEDDDYQGASFPAIVGYAANGAVVHYRATQANAAVVQPEGILLLDSGGQYLQGTTDITRTVALGQVGDEVKKHYTLVLKGNIALSRAVFPEGTTGVQLDTLARAPLWQDGLNYGHGTGHGVGHFLNVHEGPQGITPNPRGQRGQTPIMPGMLTSNEPGYYREGAYGIRIENLELCVEKMEAEGTKYYGFVPQTLFPISTGLIQKSLLSPEEARWLNEYHARVFEELSPQLEADEKDWLMERCRAI